MSSIIDRNFLQHIYSENEKQSQTHIFSSRDDADTRNYYSQLFSLESDDTEFHKFQEACRKLNTQDWTHDANDEEESSTLSISSYDSIFEFENIDDMLDRQHTDLTNMDDQNSNMSISTECSTAKSTCTDLQSCDSSIEDDLSWSDNSFDSIQMLDEKEILKCFKGDVVDPTLHEEWTQNLKNSEDKCCEQDTIATFNIQNRYDHNLAAEMMLKENYTFIALQEPHASHYKKNQKWHDFQKRELASARLSVYETQHQTILYDNWKWGGSEISKFESFQNGRITTIAFGFGKHQKIGIISIYGICESASNSEEEKKSKCDIRNTTTFLVKKIMKKWNHEFPGIGIIIMGDLQETISKEDRDNFGSYRQEMLKNGILKTMADTHTSFVRDSEDITQYHTRFGSKGARGIDHILIPRKEDIRSWFSEGSLNQQNAWKYFPSDHALISCKFSRFRKNNRTSSGNSKIYDYKQLFQIKLKSSGINKNDLSLDDSQFKDSRSYKKQAETLERVRELTAEDSHESNHYLPKIEKRIKKLFSILWEEGEKQGVIGEKNKLVKINENHALSLSHAMRGFNESVKAIMNTMKLDKERDVVAAGGNIRKSVHEGKGFKMFENLPLSTQLRYLQSSIRSNIRKMQRIVITIQRWNLLNQDIGKTGKEKFKFSDLHDILDSMAISTQATKIRKEYLREAEERASHMQATEFFKCKYKVKRSKTGAPELTDEDNNQDLPGENELQLSKPIIKLINFWLAEGGCKQGFNTETSKDRFTFLERTKINIWKHHMLHWNEETLSLSSTSNREKIEEGLEEAITKLKIMLRNTKLAQSEYKIQTLEFFIRTNKISAFTQKVLPKNREAPIPHDSIYDKSLRKWRKCKNEMEQMVATGQHHNHWMSPSRAQESCAFASVINEGNLGPRGIKLQPNRIITKSDISTLIKDGNKLPAIIQREFVAAHGHHIANLFQEPERDREEFHYPFYLKDNIGTMHEEEDLLEKYMKAIATIPGKARHEGFQIAVLGRFGKRWRTILFNLIKLMFIMRYVPPDIKKISRFPIPKPGKAGEYRPISLCHDIYCFLNGISTAITSKSIEKAGILHTGIASYREGMGCMNLVGVEQAFREDCLESGQPAVQIDEDEEKFFDRIPLEIILAAMRICGFPTQGFLELKANCMDNKCVEIITNKGTAMATFSCGLEQGNPDSPTIANLVILLKHRLWNSICEEFLETRGGIRDKCHSYTFHISDRKDGTLVIKMMGYCDDNSRFLSLLNEEDLIRLTQRFIKLTGDLSMATKIGRKGSKCEVHLYNISAETAFALKEWDTTAWSFTTDTPTKEFIPIKFSLQSEEEAKLISKIDAMKNITEIERSKWRSKIFPEEHRHLGITTTLKGITQGTKNRVIGKIKKRIIELNSQKMNDSAQRLCNNMLCTTIHSFAPLQCGHSTEGLADCDKLVASTLRSKRGLAKSDAMHRFWIDEQIGGFGFKSFVEEDIISVGRELEVILNSNDLDSRALRGRLEAYRQEPLKNTTNHIRDAVRKLAKYGIYLRDKEDELLNFVMKNIARRVKYAPMGSAAYKDSTTAGIGNGKNKLLDLGMGGKVESIVRQMLNGKSGKVITDSLPSRSPLPLNIIEKEIKAAKIQRFDEATRLYKFWEWTYSSNNTCLPQDLKKWTYIDLAEHLKKKYPETYMELESFRITEECESAMSIKVEDNVQWKGTNTKKTRYSEAMTKLMHSDSPLLIATDGSHIPGKLNEAGRTSAAFVACILKTKEGNSVCDGRWEDETTEPLLARIMDLPSKIGTEKTDIAHGEACAIWLQEASFSTSAARCVITDSEAVRKCVNKIRDGAHKTLDRKYIRTLASGISKTIMGKFRDSYRRNSIKGNTVTQEQQDQIQKFKLCSESLKLRLSVFIKQAEKWCNQGKDSEKENSEDDNDNLWPLSYWDNHETRPIIKVNSHQLDQDGMAQKQPPRYPALVPKLAPLHSNHLADVCAGLLANSKLDGSTIRLEDTMDVAISNQRFFLTWGGATMDKTIARRIRKIFQNEKLRRFRSKATQGLLWRFMPDIATTWNTVLRHKGWFRSLAGFSNSHTRALYKSECYRNGNWLEHSSKNTPDNERKMNKINMSLQCKWCNVQSSNTLEDPHGNPIKGNRTHHLLFCEHEGLGKYRKHIEEMLEAQLAKFANILQTVEGTQKTNIFLQKIRRVFENLRRSKRGCLVKPPETEASEEEGAAANSIIHDIQEGKSSFLQIFSAIPTVKEEDLQDKYLGVGEAMLFGLVPKQIDITMQAICKLENSILPQIERDIVSRQLGNLWNKVKELLIARTTGLHRIMNTTCKEKQNEWKKKFQNELELQGIGNTRRRIRDNVSTQGKRSAESTGSNTKQASNKKIKVQKTIILKTCAGITCQPSFISNQCIPAQGNKHTPSLIKQGILQCQRCNKQQTALRQSKRKLQAISTQSPTKQNRLLQEVDIQCKNEHNNYTSLMNLLDDREENQINSKALSKSKKRKISDQEKMVCKIIVEETTQTNSENENISRIHSSIDTIQKKLTKHSSRVKADAAYERKTLKQIKKETEITIIDVSSQDSENQNQHKQSEKDDLRQQRKVLMMTRWQRFSGNDLDRDIALTKQSAPPGIFFADQDAMIIINLFQLTQEWSRFGRMFRSTGVRSSKPSGQYIIPLFWGNHTNGHWTVVIIWRIGRRNRGFHLDPMGKSSTTGTVFEKIKHAFTGRRDRFSWIETECFPQVELECGIRSVEAIRIFCEERSKGAEVQQCIQAASLRTCTSENYNSINLRRKVAERLWTSE